VVSLKKPYEFIDHTADIGIKVFGKDLKELFVNAAVAMFEIIATKSQSHKVTKSPVKKFIIDKQADSLEDLLVAWLNELLFLFNTKKIVFEKFKINKIDQKYLAAQASGRSLKNYKITTEIKAITYHMLKVRREEHHWLAQIIFDV
jgi:SHS2 domain-containing protein